MIVTDKVVVLKTIKVRFRNQHGDLSRPHTIKHMQDKEGNTYYCTKNGSRKIDESSFVTDWEVAPKIERDYTARDAARVRVKSDDVTEVIQARFWNKTRNKYNRPVKIVKITKKVVNEDESIQFITEYGCLPIGHSKRLDPTADNFILEWERKGPTPVESPKKLNRSYSSKDISKLVKKGLADSREKAQVLLDEYKHISKVPGYNEESEQRKNTIQRLVSGKPIQNINQLTPGLISKKKPNVRRMLSSRVEKRYVYLKQALGMKEITQTQFDILLKQFIPEDLRKEIKRKEKRHPERDRQAIRAQMKIDEKLVKLPLGTRNGLTTPGQIPMTIPDKVEQPIEELSEV